MRLACMTESQYEKMIRTVEYVAAHPEDADDRIRRPVTENYFPTIKDLRDNHVEEEFDKYAGDLYYYSIAGPPELPDDKSRQEYERSLSYIKELLADRIVVIDDEWCAPLKEYTWKTWGDCDREKKLEILEPIMLYFERRDFDCFMDFIAGTSIAPKKKNTGTGPDSPWYKKSEGEMRSMWDEVHDF